MRTLPRNRPLVVPRPDSPPNSFTSSPIPVLLPPTEDLGTQNAATQSLWSPSNLANHRIDGHNPSAMGHSGRAPHQHLDPTPHTSIKGFPALAFHSSPPIKAWSETPNPNYTNSSPLSSTKYAIREDTRVFQFSEEEGTIHKMPPQITKYEEILVQRGFTIHDKYFVDKLMERTLRICKFETPIAMFSNYEGKSADWFIANNKIPLWFFTFLNEDGDLVEYAEPDPSKILFWYKGNSIDLAGWMAGAMGPKKGIAVCP